MRFSSLQAGVLALLGLAAAPSFAHIVLAEPVALAQTSYRATFRVGHGCGVSPTVSIKVLVPDGMAGAKPMPKPGWNLVVQKARLDKPYDDHGKPVTEDVREITWTAASPDAWLPDAYYDEFVLRGTLRGEAGPMWFKVQQVCEKGRSDWVQTPASGTSTQGLDMPAALLEVIPSGPAGHAGHTH